jgi:signal transduction histidine kinase/CHASE3 domain sensor protein
MTTAPRGTYWLVGGFVSAVLILLVAVPLALNYHTATIIDDLGKRADPADKRAAQIQEALSHEASGILGFQASREPKYAELYREQTQKIAEAIADLERLTPQLGTSVQARLSELKSTIDHWHEAVRETRLATVRLNADEFRKVVFERDYVLEQAHEAAAHLNEALTSWRSEQLSRVRTITSTFTTLNMVFAFLALLAIALVVKTVRRLGTTSSHLEHRAKAEEVLRQVAHTLTGAFSLNEVLRRITETASFAGEAESVYVELVDEDQNEFTCVADYGPGVPPTGTKGRYKGSVAEDVLLSGEPRIIRDVSDEKERPSVFGDLSRTCGKCAAMIVPLMSEGRPLGALFLIRQHPNYFTELEFPHVKILADMASVAIRRALTVEKIGRMQEEEKFLSEAASILALSLDYSATLKAVVRLAVPRIADWSSVHLIENGEIHSAEIAHADPAKIAIVQRIHETYPPRSDRDIGAVRAIRTGKAELYPEVTDEFLSQIAYDAEHLELLRELKIKSAMVAPLIARGETFGAITFAAEQPRRYGSDDLAFAEDIAHHVALALQNARLYTSSQHAIQVRDEAIRARDEVLRVVSHDLRNPVNNIQLTTKMLAAGSLSEEKRRSLVEIIDRAAGRMNRLIEDLIAVARLREGYAIPLDVRAENPAEIVEEACESFALIAHTKSIDLQCDKPRVIPTVKADRNRILQVVCNLLDNAFKFTPEGGSITVSCESQRDRVIFAVRDTGRGILQEHLPNIFNLFWQAKPTAHMGSGFGLAIAKAIVEQHGGKIWVESKPGFGTTFFFSLQVASGPTQSLAPEAAVG